MMVLRGVAQYVHCCGIKFHYYLDNCLIRHPNPAILSDHFQLFLILPHAWGAGQLVRSSAQPTGHISGSGYGHPVGLGSTIPQACGEAGGLCPPASPATVSAGLRCAAVSVADLAHLGRLHNRPLQFCLLSQWWPHQDSPEA